MPEVTRRASTVPPIAADRAWIGAPAGTLGNPTAWLLFAAYAALAGGTTGYPGALFPWTVVLLDIVALSAVFMPLHDPSPVDDEPVVRLPVDVRPDPRAVRSHPTVGSAGG